MKEQLNHKKEVHHLYFDVAQGVWGTKDIFVNMYMVKNEEGDNWVLIDTGLKSSYAKIKKMADELFGENSRPSAILLTHGHFDHTGSLCRLAAEWDVPVYAHYLEIPYLTGRVAYPPPDPSVGGGLMASMSWIYPTKPINISHYLQILPADSSVPGLPQWEYFHTPGHAPGHVSFFRKKDRVLIAGDAFVTTNQESVLSVMTQAKKLSGPPKYFTYDWQEAKRSVNLLADLKPLIAATGHGRPMHGTEMQIALNNIALHFNEEALPKHGRYLSDPAVTDASGVLYVPPKEKTRKMLMVVLGISIVTAALVLAVTMRNERG